MTENPDRTKNRDRKKSFQIRKKYPYLMGMISFFLILFLGYQLLTCHWVIQQLWLPVISDLTGYRLSASKVDLSLNLQKNAVQIRIHDLNWNNDTETMAGDCEYLSGRFYLHDLLYRKIVFLDQIDIQNARMVMYSSERKKPVRKTDQGALRLGRISVQHFVFQHEIAQDLYYTVTMQKLDASGLQPDKKDNLTAQFEFQPASFAGPVKKIQLKASAEYFLDQDFKLDDLAVMLQGNCVLEQNEKEPVGFSAYIEQGCDDDDKDCIRILQSKVIQNYGPQNDVNLGVSGFYHLKKMEGKLDIQLQSQLSEFGQIPGAGHLPFSPEQLLLESRLHLSLLNDKLDYQLSQNINAMNLNFQEKGSLKNPGVHFTGSGSYLIPQKELHLEELSLRMELDSVPCVVVENKGSFVITLPEQDISTWQVLANNASLSGNIRALDFLYFKFLLPEFVQSGICSADFLIKADSEARKIAGDLSFDLDHVNLSTGKAELINNSRLTGDMTFFSKGLQRIDELQIPTFNVQIKDHDEQIVKGTFQGGHDFRSMTTKFSGMQNWEMLRVSNWLKDPLSRHIRNELIKLQPEPMEIEMQFSSDIDWQDSKVDFLGRSLLQNCLWITSSQKNGYPLQIQTNGALHFGKDRQELQQNSHISSEGILDLALFMVSDLNSGKSSFRTQLKNLDKSVLQQIFLQIVPVTGYGQYLVRHFGYGDLSGNLYGEYHAAGGDMLIQDMTLGLQWEQDAALQFKLDTNQEFKYNILTGKSNPFRGSLTFRDLPMAFLNPFFGERSVFAYIAGQMSGSVDIQTEDWRKGLLFDSHIRGKNTAFEVGGTTYLIHDFEIQGKSAFTDNFALYKINDIQTILLKNNKPYSTSRTNAQLKMNNDCEARFTFRFSDVNEQALEIFYPDILEVMSFRDFLGNGLLELNYTNSYANCEFASQWNLTKGTAGNPEQPKDFQNALEGRMIFNFHDSPESFLLDKYELMLWQNDQGNVLFHLDGNGKFFYPLSEQQEKPETYTWTSQGIDLDFLRILFLTDAAARKDIHHESSQQVKKDSLLLSIKHYLAGTGKILPSMLSGLGKNIPEVPLIKRSSAVVTESKIQKQVNSEENILADALFLKKNSGAEHTQNDVPSIEFEEAQPQKTQPPEQIMGAASAGAEELSAASVPDNENVWPIVREPEPCTFENRETEMTLNLTNLHYKDLLHFDLKGSACWKNGVFSIDIKDSYLNDEPFFMRGMIDLYEEQGYSYDFDLRINQLNLQPFISLTLADQDGNEDKDKEKSGGIQENMVVKISGKGFTLENIDRYLQTELSGKVRKIQIPLMDSNAKNLFRIVLLPLHLLPALVDQLPDGSHKIILQQLMRTNLDLITGRRNLEFDEGEFLLKGKGSNLNIERFNIDGPMVYLNVEKGYLNPFHRHFDLHTETSFSGVVLPIHLTGSLEQPTVDSSLFLQKFLNKNSKNLLSSTFKLLTLGMGERILEGENRTQTEVPEE